MFASARVTAISHAEQLQHQPKLERAQQAPAQSAVRLPAGDEVAHDGADAIAAVQRPDQQREQLGRKKRAFKRAARMSSSRIVSFNRRVYSAAGVGP